MNVRGFLLLGTLAASAFAAPAAPVGLRCELGINPLGIDRPEPRLSWRLNSTATGAAQTAFQIRVASRPELLASGPADRWDSGRQATPASTWIPYRGQALAPSEEVFWSVRVWDESGEAGPWSEPARWTMGMPATWSGNWIMAPERWENTLLRHEFALGPGLRRALIHVSGLGHYELFLNGTKVGDDVLSPGWTDYRDTVLYDSRDVTALLREGANAVGLSLGQGMFHVVRPPGRFAKFLGSFGPQRATVYLILEYKDGRRETVETGPQWRCAPGPITFSSIYGGEDFDANRIPAGWKNPGFDASGWAPAQAAPADLGALRGFTHAAPPVVPVDSRLPVEVRPLAPGRQLVDFGRNASFIPDLRVSGPRGSVFRLTAGEVTLPDGTINRSTLGGAHRGSAWWQYTKATDDEESWYPQFYYMGGRYLQVDITAPAGATTTPRLEQVRQQVIRSATAPVGHFACSDPLLSRIRDLIVAAQASNMVSILTDCPHREKLGWLEQNHLNGPALYYEWDISRLMTKITRDIAEAQTPEGLIPNIAPEYTVFKGTFRAAAEWGASFIVVPWQNYLFTGDTEPLARHFDAMVRYVAYLEGKAAGGPLTEGLGDWNDVVLTKEARAHLTPPGVTATAHLFLDLRTLADIADVLGKETEAASLRTRAEAVRHVFQKAFSRPGTAERYGSGSDSSLALALALDLAAPEERPEILERLVTNLEQRGFSTAGAIGYRYLLQTLSAAGRGDLILKLATRADLPSYAYMLKQGATTLTENWNAQLGASQNHFFLGQILEWFYRELAGLQPDPSQPGFKRCLVRPQPVAGLSWVEASHESLYGRHAVRWDWKDGQFSLEVTLPANTTGVVTMPGRQARAENGAAPVREEQGRAIFEVPAGTHRFTSSL